MTNREEQFRALLKEIADGCWDEDIELLKAHIAATLNHHD